MCKVPSRECAMCPVGHIEVVYFLRGKGLVNPAGLRWGVGYFWVTSGLLRVSSCAAMSISACRVCEEFHSHVYGMCIVLV